MVAPSVPQSPATVLDRAEQETIRAVAISDRQNQIAGLRAVERLRQQK